MVELITTAAITVSSTLLFGYWLRRAFLLLRGQYTPPEAFSTPVRQDVLHHPAGSVPSNSRIS
jgi:hypothetical protein